MSVWLNLYSLLVSVTFVLYASLQLWDLRGSATKVVPNLQGHIKTVRYHFFFLQKFLRIC